MRIGHVVRYVVVSRLLQPAAFDELDGSKSARLKEIMQIFSRARSSTASTPKMDAWQKTHVAWALSTHRLRHQPLMSCAHSSLHHIRPAHMLDGRHASPGRQGGEGPRTACTLILSMF